jgi:stearoyl-CoA desaturase (delta-9 desaturase)
VSTRQGFYWYEYDITYYILKALSWMGIVWKLQPVPEKVLEEGRVHGHRHAPLPVLDLRRPMSDAA